MTTTLARIAFGAAAATTVVLVAAPAASAAPATTYRTYAECSDAGHRQVNTAGGPFSGLSFYCEKSYGVPAGVAGCPQTAGNDGCLGEYYTLRTRNV